MSKLSTANDGASKSNKVLAYARVSSKEQDMEGFSIAAQQKLLQAYASGNGLIIEKEFIDVETAKASGRLNFNEMVNYLKKHPGIRTLLVEKTDRLYRNPKDWVLLDELNIEIHLVKEGVVLSQDSKSSEKFFHGIKDALSSRQRKKLRRAKNDFAFSTLVRCGHCGCALSGDPWHAEHRGCQMCILTAE